MRKRVICFTVAISLIITGTMARIGYIMLNGEYTVSSSHNSYSLKIDNLQYQLYYSNGKKLTNNSPIYVAVIRPNEKCIGELYRYFSYTRYNEIMDMLSKGYPVVVEVNKKLDTKYIKIFKTYKTFSTCNQLINTSSNGLLCYIKQPPYCRKISFSVDARGRLLSGDEGTITEENRGNSQTLTIDSDIQSITYSACRNMKDGCCIVMDVKTSNILACVTKPNESYINKCFNNYAVGSVFKLIVTATALENDVKPIYNCNGNIKVGDVTFSCQNEKSHGYQTLKQALANSCNCYFVNLALELGKSNLLKTARDFGFNKDISVYDNWSIKASILPNEDDLNSKGQLALLGFGQGALLSSPLQICSSLCTVANNGCYNTPKIIASRSENKRVISETNSKILLDYMRNVVENGTGKNADDINHKSAGKTATAQTGQYINGVEQLNTWFAGVYPFDSPKYAIVVMTENGNSGSQDCCPIFRTIVENLK